MSGLQLSIAQYFHERTKYDPETISQKSQGLDWAKQPSPYKEYKLGQPFDLKQYLTEQVESLTDSLFVSRWQRLSRLLFCSYGLTARVQTTYGDPLFLRSAPSAGGLYPVELYVVSGGTPLLPAGLYNYQPRDHSLLQFWQDDKVWTSLQTACFHHPALDLTRMALVTTAVFFRSSWRYQDRAYRRIFLDAGHLLGNIELASALNDYRSYLIGGFLDEALDELLYLEPETEGAIAVIPILDLQDMEGEEHLPTFYTALPSLRHLDYPELPDGTLLEHLHEATKITEDCVPNLEFAIDDEKEDKYNFPFCTRISTVTQPLEWGANLEELESTILKRRSTRSYSGDALSLEEIEAILHFSYQPARYLDQGLDEDPDYFDLNCIETFMAVSSVQGLEEGCYYYAPRAQELRQIRFKNFRHELHYLCLGQELGRDAAATIFHTADLKMAVEKYGDRAYRYLHMDAGHLGQRINLAAIHLGLGVSGIGGFFDNRVNEVLGIPADEAVLYITTLGRPG